MTAKLRSALYKNPIRLFGPHNGHELFFRTISGVPFPRTADEMHPDEVLWLSDAEYKHFGIPCAYSIFGYSSAARPNVGLLQRLLTVRNDWSRKGSE